MDTAVAGVNGKDDLSLSHAELQHFHFSFQL